MRRRLRFAMLCASVMALLGVLAPASASARNPCPARALVADSTTICAFVTNRALVFGRTPGALVPGEINRAGTRVVHGGFRSESKVDVIEWNESAWSVFGKAVRDPVGIASYRLLGIPGLSSSEVDVKADYNRFDLEGQFARGLTCGEPGYVVCRAAYVWSRTPSYTCLGIFTCTEQPVQTIDAPATIETRPMIVKILNMTNQPLQRVSEPSLTGVVRDVEIDDPATVAAGTDGRTGVGYYHLYRDAGRSNNVAVSYAFVDGVGETTLTGSVLDIDVVIGEDGSTEKSACTVPSGGAVTIECAVHVLGDEDGILEAVVTVGV